MSMASTTYNIVSAAICVSVLVMGIAGLNESKITNKTFFFLL